MERAQNKKWEEAGRAFPKESSFEAQLKAFQEISEKTLKQGVLPKDAMKVSPAYLEKMYAQAFTLYNTGKYEEALHIFRMLVMFNGLEPKYMMGLAACLHLMKDYPKAIETYTLCSLLDPTNPMPHYHSSDCFLQMKDSLSAMLSLELTIDSCKERPEYAKIKERAWLSLESLKRELTAASLI